MALLILQSKEEFQTDKLCRAMENLGFQSSPRGTSCGLPTKAPMDCGPAASTCTVIFVVIFSLTFATFQNQGISWLKSRQLVFGCFFYIKSSAGIQNLRDKRELLTLQILAGSHFSSVFPWKRGHEYMEINQNCCF